ncbi:MULTISPECIES: MinD/ParA family ATP-binding protein [Microbacterium]|uniref:ParA family protein n=1 Tax=Microbacterium wangchenii TaxID=2541726 RepID=A0ABX5SXT9_9MICO|nr:MULTISPECIES: ParA family protein [Microbacterium]MCK6065753.1 ParA family protein [Microbacterium sp. EYE_512]QBR90070.1 ParA family protein [Microbacterium wangchenii]
MSVETTPRAHATVAGATAVFTTPDGLVEPLAASPNDDIRQTIVQRAATEARRAGVPVQLITTGDRGEHHLLIAADGTIAAAAAPASTEDLADPGSSQEGREVSTEAPGHEPLRNRRAPEPLSRPSFIGTDSATGAKAMGWRGLFARLGLGPSPTALERRANEREVSQQWPGCRAIAVANGKGGVGKTMSTAMLAAVFGRYGGGNVLAWDNNDTRGTLGWRTEAGRYDTTIKDLLSAAPDLLAPSAGISDIARFVHHQSVDRYDVLRSNPELLAVHQRILTAEFDLLMRVAARYYRVVIFDSGNDESAERWLRMVDSADQLVLPTLAIPESAESAALLLDALRERDERSRGLAENAVVVITEAEPNPRDAARIADGFSGHVRAVERIPFDPALKSGPLRLDNLRGPTRDAWIRVAAAAARGL